MNEVSPEQVRRWWRDGTEVALFDAREEGPYAEQHPFYAVSLPLGRIEQRIFELVPRLDTPVVVYDDGGGVAERAIARIRALGYTNVSRLAGGLRGYARVGELFRDVGVPSKSFGELVEAIRHTPSLSASEVKALIDAGTDMVILDARRFEEYQTMSIPGATSVPGAELTLRAAELAPSPDTLVIVNCAGRTRSIIGTQTLVNAGLPNRVAALRNGTIGWTLEGFSLDTGARRRAGDVTPETHARARAAASRWAERVGVQVIDRGVLERYAADTARTLYRFDVRTPDEYVKGHPHGFLSAQGGQLVQATEEWVAVRGARIVLWDDDGVRARMTASWLVQMGWDALVVEDASLVADEQGMPPARVAPRPDVTAIAITVEELRAAGDAAIVDLATSPAYRKGHIPGARFVVPSRFAADLAALPGSGPIVLTSPDGAVAEYLAADVASFTPRPVRVLTGGTEAWAAAGHPLERDRHHWLSPAEDVYKRPYEGTDNAREAMQAYIDWELQLVAQLANDGVSNFHVVRE